MKLCSEVRRHWKQVILGLTDHAAVQLLGARAWKNPVLALLAINTAIAMKQTDGFLSTKLVDPTYASYPGRMDTTIAGKCPTFSENDSAISRQAMHCYESVLHP